jgi:peptidoglycan hydrolase-like protein with peptidoglycan-binding domain
MTNEQQRIILYRKLKQKGKLKSEDNTDFTFKDFSDSYFTDKNNFEKLYYFATSNIELQDEDGNPVELKYFYQNYACDLSWAKKLPYCLSKKYSSKWSSDSCVPTYAQENDGTITTDGSYKIGENYYYPNGDVKNKTAVKIGTYQCIDGEPKITPVTAQQTQPSTETGTWQSCVASRKDINYNESKTTGTYTSSVENVGNVTLNINGTFTATGSKFPNGGNWSCTTTGKIFLDYPKSTQQSATQTKPKFEWKTTLATPENVENGELIKYGMFGSIVKQIQQLLINNGYKDISKTGQADGKFGNRTKNAVLSFQKDNGLTQDGVVGPKTWNTLQVPKSTKSIEISTPKELPFNKPEQQPMTASEFSQIQQENNMKNLNKIIKESLVETKESKKKLIQESKITDLRFKMIVESENKQDLEEVLEEVLLEMIYLHNQGFNNQIIAESVDGIFSILSTLFKKTPNAIVDTFKEKGVNFIVSKLGMEENTYLKNFLVTVLGNTNIVDIPKLFTDCNFLTKKIAESIPEAYLRKLEYEKGMGNVFMDGIRNALYDVIRSSDFAQRIENSIAGVVCPIVDKLTGKFEDSIGTMKNKLIGNTQA